LHLASVVSQQGTQHLLIEFLKKCELFNRLKTKMANQFAIDSLLVTVTVQKQDFRPFKEDFEQTFSIERSF
jgi:hypothetical protein